MGDVDGDCSANTEILLLPDAHTISILPGVLEDTVGGRGSLHIGAEILVTFKTGTEVVRKIIRHRQESSGQG